MRAGASPGERRLLRPSAAPGGKDHMSLLPTQVICRLHAKTAISAGPQPVVSAPALAARVVLVARLRGEGGRHV